MIYFTGDMHGDYTRIKKCKLKKQDFLIICGDFGFIWNGSKKEKKLLKKLGKRRFTILFVDGAHENYNELLNYPAEKWNGGMTRKISGKLRQLMRGEVFEIDGKKIFAFGGGMPVEDFGDEKKDDVFDDDENSENLNIPEIPSIEEYENGTANLTANNNTVDYVVTHEAPGQIAEFIELSRPERRHLNAYFDKISETCTYKKWFFGQHHMNKIITAKYTALYDKIISAEQNPKNK